MIGGAFSEKVTNHMPFGGTYSPRFSGCEEREVIAFEYTSEILIEKECPSEDIVWAGRFETPRKSGGILTYSDSRFFGIVDDQQIEVIKLSQEKNYFKPFANNVNANLSKLLGISREKLRANSMLLLMR